MATKKAVTTQKSVLAQMQKWGCTEKKLRDYVLRQEEFYNETADTGTTFTRWIQLKMGCSWPAAEVVIRWGEGDNKRPHAAPQMAHTENLLRSPA
jgi:hypothetical protein